MRSHDRRVMTIGINTSASTIATVINVIGGAETISTTDRAKMMTASARMLIADPATSSYAMSEARVIGSISDADLKKMIQGTCAITGQTGAASQLGTCEELQVDCTAHTPVPSTDDGCTADDIPDCDNVTVDEYVACTRGTFAVGIQYLSAITCETDLESLAAPGKVSACAGPFARCPEYAAAFQ